MEVSSLPDQQQNGGAPVEQGAEATREAIHLFQYSGYVHAGADAEECEHRQDGKCENPDHFHAWVCMPNSLQGRDIEDKARAAKARRKRALRDAGSQGRPASDAYVTLEAELDDLLADDREALLKSMAERDVRKTLVSVVDEVREDDRFENYGQDSEEFKRLEAMPEEERPAEEWDALNRVMTDFTEAVEERIEFARQRERERLAGLSEDDLRDALREWRIESDSQESWIHTYYTWLAFVGTRQAGNHGRRYFPSLEDFRNASPEAVNAIEDLLRELEARLIRGDAAGN